RAGVSEQRESDYRDRVRHATARQARGQSERSVRGDRHQRCSTTEWTTAARRATQARDGSAATASISTRTPRGSPATATVERAGRASPSTRAYTSFTAPKSAMSTRKIVVFTTRDHDVSAADSTA